jgi:outer membrane protein
MPSSPFFRVSVFSKFQTLTATVALLGGLAVMPCVAAAETLKEALTAAYLFNPTLKDARAALRSIDNGVSQAKSGYRPTVSATLTDAFEDTRERIKGLTATTGATSVFLPNGTYNPRTAQIGIQQNVFDGFRTYNAVKGSEALVEAGREDLRSSESNVLLNAATAYMNVVRDQAIVSLRQNNIKVLSEQLRATEDRFKVGEVTRTDVAQAQATLASAQADLSIAQGTLYGDQAFFQQFIGHPPGTLKDPGPPDRLLPKTLQGALGTADAENPGVIGAIFRERAQEHTVKQVKGQLLPTLSLNATYTKGAETTSPFIAQFDDTRVLGTLNIPLYEAGNVSAQIRAAIETLSQRRQQIDEQRQLAHFNVASQWGLIIAARGNIAAGESQVRAAEISLQGVREEERVGQRTILDVLSAEQTLLNAQVFLVSFRRDLVVASYNVLSAMGRLTAADISLAAELYDPTRYYGEVKDAWYGWGASIESQEDPRVPAVRDPGRTPGQKSTDGPAYTQKLPPVP